MRIIQRRPSCPVHECQHRTDRDFFFMLQYGLLRTFVGCPSKLSTTITSLFSERPSCVTHQAYEETFIVVKAWRFMRKNEPCNSLRNCAAATGSKVPLHTTSTSAYNHLQIVAASQRPGPSCAPHSPPPPQCHAGH